MNGKQVMALLIAGAMLMQAAPAQTFAAPRNVRTEKEKKESYMDGANGFAFRLTDELLSAKKSGENLLVSPYSVWLPLAALVNSSDEAAKKEMLNVLGAGKLSKEELNQMAGALNLLLLQEERRAMYEEAGETYEGPLKIANAMFVSRDGKINESFAKQFETVFGGKLFDVDFADSSAVNEVNRWAKEQTEGKIDKVIESFDPATSAAIANALYFSDSWANQFMKENNTDGVFYGAKGDEHAVFMNQKLKHAAYYEDGRMQAVVLNTIKGGEMVLFLPKQGISPEEALKSLDAKKLQKIEEAEERCVQLSLPGFRMESEPFSLKEALEALGVPLTDERACHLTGLMEGEALYLSEALQKAMIEVDEDGLTAAAVTVMGIERMALLPETEPVELTFDRPFGFVLTGDAGQAGQQVLFAGVVNELGNAAK